MLTGIHTCDVCDDECYACLVSQAAQVDRDVALGVMTGKQARHHA
jgi:hypothetical protein